MDAIQQARHTYKSLTDFVRAHPEQDASVADVYSKWGSDILEAAVETNRTHTWSPDVRRMLLDLGDATVALAEQQHQAYTLGVANLAHFRSQVCEDLRQQADATQVAPMPEQVAPRGTTTLEKADPRHTDRIVTNGKTVLIDPYPSVPAEDVNAQASLHTFASDLMSLTGMYTAYLSLAGSAPQVSIGNTPIVHAEASSEAHSAYQGQSETRQAGVLGLGLLGIKAGGSEASQAGYADQASHAVYDQHTADLAFGELVTQLQFRVKHARVSPEILYRAQTSVDTWTEGTVSHRFHHPYQVYWNEQKNHAQVAFQVAPTRIQVPRQPA